MKPTDEQIAIVNSSSPFLRVDAFAGATKTSSLVMYANARPSEKMLYIAFNKSIKEEAEKRFPSNVKCMTSHGAAFARFGSAYADAGKLVADIRVSDVINALGLKDYPDQFAMYIGDVTLKVLTRFLCSKSHQIGPEMAVGLVMPNTGVSESDIVFCAQKLWKKMVDIKDPDVGMLHDGYLKLFHLSEPKLRYDRILFDEVQDSNAVTAAIVQEQRCPKVIVGDTHQAIYQFRGAVNAMRMFDADQTLYLSKSFRFGQGIADVANVLLSTYKGEKRKLLGTDAPSRIGPLDPRENMAVIARSNGTLFTEAVHALNQNKRLHFVGGIEGYRLGALMDVFNLSMGNRDAISSGYMRAFKDIEAAEQFAELSDDRELKSAISTVKRHNQKIPSLVARIKQATVKDPSQAQLHLTTAHKSKGLEWDNVRLTDDYADLLDDKNRPVKPSNIEEEDINILYVAATRAKKKLQPFPQLAELLSQHKRVAQAEARVNQMPDWARPVTGLSPRR